MTKLLTGLAVGAAMFVGVGIAQAEPLKLTGPQMDSVTAGLGFADATARARARGGFVNVALTSTRASATPFSARSSSASTACSTFFGSC